MRRRELCLIVAFTTSLIWLAMAVRARSHSESALATWLTGRPMDRRVAVEAARELVTAREPDAAGATYSAEEKPDCWMILVELPGNFTGHHRIIYFYRDAHKVESHPGE